MKDIPGVIWKHTNILNDKTAQGFSKWCSARRLGLMQQFGIFPVVFTNVIELKAACAEKVHFLFPYLIWSHYVFDTGHS